VPLKKSRLFKQLFAGIFFAKIILQHLHPRENSDIPCLIISNNLKGTEMLKNLTLSIIASGILLTGAAQASVTLVTSSSALGANDSISWTQLGPAFTVLTGPQAVTSTGGLAATVTSAGNTLERRDQGSGWAGNFANGAPLLWTRGVGPDITLSFAAPVYGAGAQFQADIFGPFTAEVIGIGGSVLGTFTENGTSNSAGDDSAIFIGILSDTADISSIVFHQTGGNDFAIGNVALNTSDTPAAVPEPASLSLLGLGLIGFISTRRKSAN
jgi:hypothetical protein